METLRHAYRLVWIALTWFALSIGAVAASAIINPQAVELICSGGHGIKMVVKGDGGAPVSGPPPGRLPLVRHGRRPAAGDGYLRSASIACRRADSVGDSVRCHISCYPAAGARTSFDLTNSIQ